MALKILGAQLPSATVNTDLYTAPAGKEATVIVFACNTDTSATATIRIAVRDTTLGTKHYIEHGLTLAKSGDPSNANSYVSEKITMGPAEVITVYTSNGNVAFQARGDETDVSA